MKEMGKYAVILLAGFALGAGAIQGLHAQAGKAPAYAIAEVEVTDPPLYQAYLVKAPHRAVEIGGGLTKIPRRAEALGSFEPFGGAGPEKQPRFRGPVAPFQSVRT